MDINIYIQQLLEASESVIIPEFGSIKKTRVPTSINKVTHVVTPSRVKLTFDGSANVSDGTLEKLIADSEKCTIDHAKIQIKDFVANIYSILTKGEIVTFDGIGYFKPDSTGKFFFHPLTQSDDIGNKDISIKPLKSIPKQDKTSSAVKKPKVKPQVKKPQPKPAVKKTNTDKPARKSNRWVIWTVAATLLLIISTGVGDYFINFSGLDIKSMLVVSDVSKPDTLAADSAQVAETSIIEDAAKPKVIPTLKDLTEENTTVMMYVIWGSFKEKQGALSFIDESKSTSLKFNIIERDGYFRVYSMKSLSKKIVLDELDNIKLKGFDSAWIYKEFVD